MNPQQDGYLSSHYGTLNRSPSSTRPGYATMGGMNPGRPGQRPVMDSLSQQMSNMNPYGDEHFGTFNSNPRYDRQGPSPAMSGSFMFGNTQAWNYTSSASTVNDPSRMRGVARRAQLPSEWAPMGDAGMVDGRVGMQRGQLQNHYPQPSLGMGAANGQMYTLTPTAASFAAAPDLRPQLDPDEDGPGLIKTAIVIKNIPFNVRKEALQNLMVEMNLPQPYAFNYHFDQGVFRGLAFANFAHPEETKIVINSMNGMDVSGRKLRVEYKKMLPEHERERIEREKREKRGQLEEQHRTMPPLQHQPSSSALQTMSISEAAANSFRKHGIDIHNPGTLKFYIELYMFERDPKREILIFPSEVTPEERREIHVLSHSLGFHHSSVGDGENRQVVVRKSPTLIDKGVLSPPTGATLDAHPRGLSRAATIDFAEQSRVAPSGAFYAQHRAGGLLGVPGSPDGPHALNGLRGVKSFADLRSFSPSPSPSVTSASNVGGSASSAGVGFIGHYTTDSGFPSMPMGPPPSAGTDGSSPAPMLSVGGLNSLTRAAFDSGSSGTIGRPRDVPGPGAIGSQRPGANGGGAIGRVPERQPRGPGGEASGFGPRGRQNGHMQRSSDSSDTARTGTSGSTWN